MGKGIIKSGGDDGLYGIELTLHRDRVDATIEIINAQIEALAAKINGMEEGDAKELKKLMRASYQKRKDYLQLHMPEDPTISAWCGDLTEDLSGNVGTIEVPGERGTVLIQPGYEGNAVYNSTRDGQLQPSIAGTPAGTFYNLAMLPGWQKWMPIYRYGTISNIDTDANTCDVALEAAISSQQSLSVNQADTLTGISIEYMSCNASAFEDGDEVLVKFEGQDWSGAKVVGFKDNPKTCEYEFYIRPTFNGFIPTVGGEQIKLENNDTSETATTLVVGDFAGLCGPFSQNVDTGDEYISLGAGNYFAHYVEASSGDASSHLGYSFPDWWYDPVVKTFQVGAVPVESAILHVNKVNWLRYSSILSGCPKTIETIDGMDYSVYQVDFTELYFLTETETCNYIAVHVAPTCTQGCGPIPIDPWEPNITSNLTMIQSNSNVGRSYGGPLICEGYQWPFQPLSDRKAEEFNVYRNHTSSFGLNKEQVLILSNEFGQNPSYPGFTINTNFYIKSQKIWFPWSGGAIPDECEINDTDYSGYGTYTYQMVLTPESAF